MQRSPGAPSGSVPEVQMGRGHRAASVRMDGLGASTAAGACWGCRLKGF